MWRRDHPKYWGRLVNFFSARAVLRRVPLGEEEAAFSRSDLIRCSQSASADSAAALARQRRGQRLGRHQREQRFRSSAHIASLTGTPRPIRFGAHRPIVVWEIERTYGGVMRAGRER